MDSGEILLMNWGTDGVIHFVKWRNDAYIAKNWVSLTNKGTFPKDHSATPAVISTLILKCYIFIHDISDQYLFSSKHYKSELNKNKV